MRKLSSEGRKKIEARERMIHRDISTLRLVHLTNVQLSRTGGEPLHSFESEGTHERCY
jgi:hypothetical protein